MSRLQEFQTLKTSGYITVPFSVVWSQDNFVAYLTDRGVNVFELRFSGVNKESAIIVKRWFVKPRQFFPTYDCLINVAKLGETLHPDQLLRLVLDRTLTPKACLSGNTIHPLTIAWAPFSHHLSETSLLTILTDQGSLDIYRYGEANWSHAGCITECWLSMCSKMWDNDCSKPHTPNTILEELKSRAYSIRITGFCWGKCHEDKWWSLFTGNQSGEIMEWKVEVEGQHLQVSQLFLMKTDLESVVSLHSLPIQQQAFMVLVGCSSGKVQCLVVDEGQLKNKSMVWSDQDQMPVPQNGSVATLLPQGILYIVPKLGHLLFFWLDSEANLINFTTYSTDDICISGIAWVRDSEFLVSTRSGEILSVKVKLDSGSLDASVLPMDSLSKTNGSSYHGISLSRNKCIAAIPYSVCTPHDPSLVKEPSTLGLYYTTTRGELQDFLDLKTESFYYLWDFLHLFRLDSCGQKELGPKEEDDVESYNSLDIVQLKKSYWLNMYRLTLSEDVNSESHKTRESLCRELKRAVISYYLFRRVNELISRECNEDEKRSLVCARIWLVSYSRDSILKLHRKKAASLVEALNSRKLEKSEKCPLCDSECLPLGPELTMLCRQGHTASRCPRTLLPITAPPYYTCFYCTETSAFDEKVCVLCDAPLRFNRLLLRD